MTQPIQLTHKALKRLIFEDQFQAEQSWTLIGNSLVVLDPDTQPDYPFALVKLTYKKYNVTRKIKINWLGVTKVEEIYD